MEEIECEESLLISKSRYDIPHVFKGQEEMESEYVESGEGMRWSQVGSELFGKPEGNQ